ncbi:mannose-1-phosphate guanylyltransferase/mannose-6-phosphate isomerase [Rhizomicrobium palustre]|uniref:mannose-1-phosphate guanylyltransferase n=1 Tax=Rhizomicrobium palustre TaxID=189966 RepID=A0A846N2U8_9PROT|nr:mannose-1-phosphate guanylyltransferase/mannose-6-phosphate isomerase [Rhizomicrobium palustre]NIK89839.1 mannose-1-phosphate guanylyltransferase/mannose-6-phosphate isomerase [Rhizomicrobium palustre]
MESQVYPVILSGGSGTRLWPRSRASLPKQLLPLCGERTMIQETVLRAALPDTAGPIIICNEAHRFLVAEQMEEIGVKPDAIVLEPVARNTAPAAAVAAAIVAEDDPEGIVVLLPSDHVVTDVAGFKLALQAAVDAARAGNIVTFGMTPTHAETGYGYIQKGAPLSGGAYAVERFVEKPDAPTAERYLESGDYYWNSGMFVFRADVLLEEIATHAPAILPAIKESVALSTRDLNFYRLEVESFARAPNISFDYAVMEHTARAVMVPCDFGWNDVGSWSALLEVLDRDDDGNVLQGDVLVEDVENSLVSSGRGVTALVGVKDLVVIVTKDATLIADKNRAQDVKKIVDKLQKDKRAEAANHATMFRPWGSYETIDHGDRFQVKHIMVKPGESLSLQMHYHRAEHWIVVQGTARVTCDGEVRMLRENESTFIPLGATHRLENPGKVPLRLIEVQSGAYLGEDDIVRFEDIYGRVAVQT